MNVAGKLCSVSAFACALLVGTARAEYSTLQWQVADANMEFAFAAVRAFGTGGYTAYLMDAAEGGPFGQMREASDAATHTSTGVLQSRFAGLDAGGRAIDLASDDYTFQIALFGESGSELLGLSVEKLSFSDLESKFCVTTPPNATGEQVWTVSQFYAVPEPTGGLLFLLGVAGLALKRKRA